MKRTQEIRSGISSALDRFGRWRASHIPDTPFLFFLAILTGGAAGTAAHLFKWSIAAVSRALVSGLDTESSNWLLFVLPFCGILLTGILTRYIMRQNLAHGSRQMCLRVRQKQTYIAPARMFDSIIAGTVTLGFGGSAGSEGPIVDAGGAIGSNFGRWARLSSDEILLMIGCGVGAATAGLFKAPIAGALFTLEVLRLPITTVGVLALFLSTIVAALTSYALGGYTLAIPMFGADLPYDSTLLPCVISLGILCGFYSVYYSFFMKHVEILFNRLSNPWIKNVIAGVIIGGMVFVFPAFYGEGYGVLGELLNGDFGSLLAAGPFATASGGTTLLILVTLAMVVLKCFATSDTNSGGGVGGDFAPTLFSGGLVGLLFAVVLNKYFNFGLPTELFILFGMAGVMAGVIRAPLMSWMLVIEIVGDYANFLPLFVVSICSFTVVRMFTSDTFFLHLPDRFNGMIHHLLRLINK